MAASVLRSGASRVAAIGRARSEGAVAPSYTVDSRPLKCDRLRAAGYKPLHLRVNGNNLGLPGGLEKYFTSVPAMGLAWAWRASASGYKCECVAGCFAARLPAIQI